MKRFFMILSVLCVALSSLGCVKVVKSVRMDANGKPEEYTEVQVGAIPPPPCGCGYVHHRWHDWYDCNRTYVYEYGPPPCRTTVRRVVGVVRVDVHH